VFKKYRFKQDLAASLSNVDHLFKFQVQSLFSLVGGFPPKLTFSEHVGEVRDSPNS
jgi:hypothetical protein